MAKPVVVLVPGFWEGPECFDYVKPIIEAAGYETQVAKLASTGCAYSEEHPPPSILDDVASIRQVIESTVEKGLDVFIGAHSAGSFLSADAIEGLDRAARVNRGKQGGVIYLAFVSGGLMAEGFEHVTLPFYHYEGQCDASVLSQLQYNVIWCKNPRQLLWNDVPSDAEAEHLNNLMKPQPAKGWDGPTRYCGWRAVPSSYMVCERDMVVPPDWQRRFLALARCKEVPHDVGHMAPLTAPRTVAAYFLQQIQEALDGSTEAEKRSSATVHR